MPYAQSGLITAVSGIRQDLQFRLNSIFDPNYTGVGHQPLAHDQWALFYNHNVVTKVSWEIEMLPSATSTCTFYVSDDATIPATSTDGAELYELGAQGGLGNFYIPPVVMRGELDVAEFFNRPKGVDLILDSELRATFGASPTEVVFGTLSLHNPTGTSTVTATYLMTLVFTVKMAEPKDLAQS